MIADKTVCNSKIMLKVPEGFSSGVKQLQSSAKRTDPDIPFLIAVYTGHLVVA